MLPFDERGSGPAVVLLHAGVADRTMWSDLLAPLAALGFRVVAFDMPGFGEAPTETSSQAPAPWERVLESMDELSIDRAALIGSSYGGAVALRVAAVAPQRLWALVCVSAAVPGMEPSPELLAAWDAEEKAFEDGDVDRAVQAAVDAWTLPDAPAELRERVARMQRRAYEQGDLPADAEEDDPSDPLAAGLEPLSGLEVPLLALVGELDKSDFRDGCDLLARVNDDARAVPLRGAGHLAPLEMPEVFLELTGAFLREAATSNATLA